MDSISNTCPLKEELFFLPYKGSPERALLQYFRSQGWIGEHTEGHTIQNILRTLILPALIRFNPFQTIGDETTPYLQMMHSIIGLYSNPEISRHNMSSFEFIQFLHETIESRINLPAPIIQKDFDIISEYMSDIVSKPSNHGTPVDIFLDSISSNFWHSLLDIYAKKDRSLGYGWPDLELSNGEEIMLVEVKVKDNLTEWQKETIPILLDLGINCRIIRLISK